MPQFKDSIEYTDTEGSKASLDGTTSVSTVDASTLSVANADAIKQTDTRSTNEPPTFYYKKAEAGQNFTVEFKESAAIGLSGQAEYCQLQTYAKWTDATGGDITQVAVVDNNFFIRKSTGSTGWGAWERLLKEGEVVANATNATNATNASNVNSTINGTPISKIIESDGYTAKIASYSVTQCVEKVWSDTGGCTVGSYIILDEPIDIYVDDIIFDLNLKTMGTIYYTGTTTDVSVYRTSSSDDKNGRILVTAKYNYTMTAETPTKFFEAKFELFYNNAEKKLSFDKLFLFEDGQLQELGEPERRYINIKGVYVRRSIIGLPLITS